jgi:Aminotransferase class I and II
MSPPTRLAGLGTTVFTEMTALAMRTGALNLGQGFPDVDGPAEVIEAAVSALRSGENQYAPLPGVPALRQAVLEHQRRWYRPEPEDVQITFGATEAVAAALPGLCDPGDEVVVLEPYYDSYAACIAFAGATRRPVTLRPPEFAFDEDELRSAIGPRARVVLLNSPHNPVEDRLVLGAGAAGRRDPEGQAVPDLRRRDAAAARGRGGSALAARRGGCHTRQSAGPAGRAVRWIGGGGTSADSARRYLLRQRGRGC